MLNMFCDEIQGEEYVHSRTPYYRDSLFNDSTYGYWLVCPTTYIFVVFNLILL